MGNYPGMLGPTSLPPCHRSANRAFTALEKAPAQSVRAALRMCEHCPMRRSCAREALTAGSSLDGGFTAPATDVVMAGVACRGDQSTATELARVAGTPPPRYTTQAPRGRVPSHCRECRHPMSSWTRNVEAIPPGHVQHHARGWCVNCRPAYNRALEAERSAGEPDDTLRKQMDRKRHHPETAVARVRTRGRREGWTQEQVAAAVAAEEALVEEEKEHRRAEARRAREEEKAQRRAEAEAAGWELTTREVAELVGVTLETVRTAARRGLLSRTTWPGVAGYLYRLDDVVEMWPDA